MLWFNFDSLHDGYQHQNGGVCMDPGTDHGPPQRDQMNGSGMHRRSHSSVGTGASAINGYWPLRGNGYVDRSHNRWQQTTFLPQPPGDSVSSMIKSLESLDVNKPSFVGAFREDNVSRNSPPNMKYSTPRRPLPTPRRPVAPPRKKKDKKKYKRKSKDKVIENENIYEEAADDTNDINDVVNELHDLYASNINKGSSGGFSRYMEWPDEETNHRHTRDFYRASLPSSSSGSGIQFNAGADVEDGHGLHKPGAKKSTEYQPPPAEPPEDYSPILTRRAGFDLHVASAFDTTSTSIDSNMPTPDYHEIKRSGDNDAKPVHISVSVIPLAPPPPPPPLPPPPPSLSTNSNSDESDRKPPMPLARDLITQRSQLKKTQKSSNRKSRPRARADRSGGSVSSRVGEIRDILEDKGICDVYMDNSVSSGENIYQNTLMFTSDDEDSTYVMKRDASPRELSPSTRFTYLPNGILTKPRLRKVSQGELFDPKRSEGLLAPKHAVSFQIQRRNMIGDTANGHGPELVTGRSRTTSENSMNQISGTDDDSIYALPAPTALPRVRHSLRKKLEEKRQSLGLENISDGR